MGPHIHTPGTLLNDQFGSTDPWDAYLTGIESGTPKIEATGVTDYYLTDSYEEFLRRNTTGRLVGVKMIFPNIELRLDVAAKLDFVNYSSSSAVNSLSSSQDSNTHH